MIETYELKLEIGFTNSKGDCNDWDILAFVNVEKLDCGDFNCVAESYLNWDERHVTEYMFSRPVECLPLSLQEIIHAEAKLKFQELKAQKESSNEQY